MSAQLQEYIILTLAASINFTMMAVVLLLLDKPDGMKKGFYYLIGSELVLLIIGLIFLWQPNLLMHFKVHRSFATFDIVVGSILVLLGIRNYFHKPAEKELPQLKDKAAWRYLARGFIMMAINFSTLAVYLVVIKDIVLLTQRDAMRFLLLAISNIMIMIMVWSPLVFNNYYPEAVEKFLKPVNDFVKKHEKQVLTIIFFAVGIFLIYRGLTKI